MPITDPIFIPKDKDLEFPSEFWIIPACGVGLSGTQAETNRRRAMRRRVNQLGGSKEVIKVVSDDWSEEIKSLAIWDIDSDALIELIKSHAPGFFYHIVGDAVRFTHKTYGNRKGFKIILQMYSRADTRLLQSIKLQSVFSPPFHI